ncbi:hypothetical protein PQZ43_02075 [Alphaproteobacteria bacterium]|jgi:hypothetical protein|nr:hypothetical protein [Alphaproteobacteria bacterium]MDC6451625.1 hypothetical protein [Alphaproteobacteria bacterium]
MNKVFLGLPSHWLMIIITSAVIFACGINKMHVSNFNLFIFIVFVSIAVLVGFVLKTSKQKN